MKYEEVRLEGVGARLDCYLMDPAIATGCAKTRPAVLLLPGGAYLTQAHNEGEPVAMRLLSLGLDVFILRYSTYITNAEMAGREEPSFDEDSHYPRQLVQAMCAMGYIRRHADAWDIDPHQVTAMGFSAGGHICGMLSERFDNPELLSSAGVTAEEARPDSLALCYPMVTANLVHGNAMGDPKVWTPILARGMFGTPSPSDADYDTFDLREHVRPDMPRTFVWQTAEDRTVDPIETLELVTRMRRAGVPCELHLFERGHHGMALADRTSAGDERGVNDAAAAWVGLFHAWHALEDGLPLSHAQIV